MEKTFIQQSVEGRVALEDIDLFVSRWHEGAGDVPLHDCLGMTWDEYALWVREPEVLAHIVTAHKEGRSIDSVLEDVQRHSSVIRGDFHGPGM